MAAAIKLATREDVKNALDSAETARNNAQIDRALDAATDAIVGLCHRTFWPEVDTRYFDWPNPQSPTTWRLWLDANELGSSDNLTITAAGVVIPSSDYVLYPNSGPPYNRVEINLGTSSSFSAGDTHQQQIAITGPYAGCALTEAAAGALAASANASVSTVDVTDSAAVGVGTILRCGNERMIVTEKTMLTTGQTLQAPGLDAKNSTTGVPVGSGAAFVLGETVLIDSERMLIVDIAGNTLTVKRAWDGSVLAAHTAGATIYAPRRCAVDRGALGTTAAAHNNADALYQHRPPPAVRTLAIAEAIVVLGQEGYGYAQQLRPLEGGRRTVVSIQDQRDVVYARYGRKARTRAVRR